MPALYAIAQHPALVHAVARRRGGLCLYLDDIYVVAAPERIRELQDACQRALHEHAHIELNRGKTRIWNAAGEEPANMISDLRGHSEEPESQCGPETGLSPPRSPRSPRPRHAAWYGRVRCCRPRCQEGNAATSSLLHP